MTPATSQISLIVIYSKSFFARSVRDASSILAAVAKYLLSDLFNRSTFYLHYETMSDLLSESVGRMNEQFLASMEKDSDAFSTKLRNCPRDELYLITPDYLTPYLSYIKNNKRLFRTATENAAVLGMDKSYDRMFRHVFTPILDRYGVLQQDRPYIMAFYIRGLMAIISEWLKNDCTDSITYVTGVIQQCVKMPQSETTNAV